MTGNHKINLPKGLKRAKILHRDKDRRISADDYSHAVDEDFSRNRIAYRQIEYLGLLIFVKVEQS